LTPVLKRNVPPPQATFDLLYSLHAFSSIFFFYSHAAGLSIFPVQSSLDPYVRPPFRLVFALPPCPFPPSFSPLIFSLGDSIGFFDVDRRDLFSLSLFPPFFFFLERLYPFQKIPPNYMPFGPTFTPPPSSLFPLNGPHFCVPLFFFAPLTTLFCFLTFFVVFPTTPLPPEGIEPRRCATPPPPPHGLFFFCPMNLFSCRPPCGFFFFLDFSAPPKTSFPFFPPPKDHFVCRCHSRSSNPPLLPKPLPCLILPSAFFVRPSSPPKNPSPSFVAPLPPVPVPRKSFCEAFSYPPPNFCFSLSSLPFLVVDSGSRLSPPGPQLPPFI